MRLAGLLVALASAISVHSYVPALATNDTQAAIAGGLNVTDISKLHMQWHSNGFSFLIFLILYVLLIQYVAHTQNMSRISWLEMVAQVSARCGFHSRSCTFLSFSLGSPCSLFRGDGEQLHCTKYVNSLQIR
jgi:hypothetical protein